MFDFLKKDPLEKAKKHVEKALREIEANYFDYASMEYEKAANRFIEAGSPDFAIKYFREAAYCALEDDDFQRGAQMKICAAETLLEEGRFDEAGGFYQEASDHLFRNKKLSDSIRTLSVSIMCHLAARSFDTAVNLLRKSEKRLPEKSPPKVHALDVAREYVGVLVEGYETTLEKLNSCISKFKPKESEQSVFDFLTDSVRLALDTHIEIEWAGQSHDKVPAKTPLEFELRYRCPIPVRVIDYRLTLSNSVTFIKEPEIGQGYNQEESWLLTVNPVLSGGGIVGPFKLTLEGERILVHKHSNQVEFLIEKAPSDLSMVITPERISCDLGDEVVLDVHLSNAGEGPADNIELLIKLSDGLELSLGSADRMIQFLGPSENMRLQIYVRGVGMGDELVTVKLIDGRTQHEIVKTTMVRVG
ncbi:MAG: hypothetical protein KAQ65_00720 [Candidatus Thorarchaeota archaeon]|nr:hypothetical protein [Candidatus Thorarchaeota archaeon]